MIDAGILDGDYLIVRQQSNASNGEIIVAIVEDEATVKRFFRINSQVELRPENSFMEPMIFDDIEIAGKIVGLLRRF